MNWFDRAIAAIDPEAGMRRLRARAALQVMDGVLAKRSYDGGKMGRRTQGWTARSDAPTQSVIVELNTLRNRSRDLVRNNPYARRAVSTIQRHMVRGGIQAVWDNQMASKAWKSWCKRADFRGQTTFAGLQSQVVRCWEEAGEVLIRKRITPSSMEMAVPLQLEVLEPDYLATWKTQQLQDGFIIAGVEFDKEGRRRGYWLYPSHPGETIPLQANFTPVFVAASEIIHAYSMVLGRPGQVRGVPQLATAMLRLRDLDEYQEAELVRKKIEACFAVFVTNSSGNAPGIPGVTSAVDPVTQKRIETVAPGLIEYMRPDEDVKFGQPTASPVDGYTREMLHSIAAGSEVTYEQMTGDLTQVNFSSMRAGKLEFFALIDQKQQLEFIPQVCNPITAWWAQLAFINGAVRAKGIEPTDWTCPKPEFTDPLKDVLALKEQVRGGMMSLREAIRLSGYDPETTVAEIIAEREELKKAGVIVDTNAEVATLKLGAGGSTEPAAPPVKE